MAIGLGHIILTAIVSLAVGGAGISVISYLIGKGRLKGAKSQVDLLLDEAKNKAQNLVKEAELECKGLRFKTREDLEKETNEKQKELQTAEKRLQGREEGLEKRFEKLTKHEEELEGKEKTILDREKHIEGLEKRYMELVAEERKHLEKISGITSEEAKRQLRESLIDEAKSESARMILEIEEKAKEEAAKKARMVIGTAVERMASDYVAESSISVVQLPSDEMKGRIIGREGRNIRAFEAATGIDVVIDDTPEAVILSGYDPVRRQVAKLSLEYLIADGRIHPTRIEEMVEKVAKEVDATIKSVGESTCMDLGVTNVHPELVKLLGTLKYRTSFGQNVLQHSKEVAYLAGIMADEIGENGARARRAGLLHDIGKAVSHEEEGSHALIGSEHARRYREDADVVHAIAAHHEDVAQVSVLDCLIDAADALSGARPGARREVLEAYVKRLQDLEKVCATFGGVEKAYAIQAGREIRVIVANDRVNDAEALVLAKDISRKIEQDMTYPGQIKVTVVRETRAVEYAK